MRGPSGRQFLQFGNAGLERRNLSGKLAPVSGVGALAAQCLLALRKLLLQARDFHSCPHPIERLHQFAQAVLVFERNAEQILGPGQKPHWVALDKGLQVGPGAGLPSIIQCGCPVAGECKPGEPGLCPRRVGSGRGDRYSRGNAAFWLPPIQLSYNCYSSWGDDSSRVTRAALLLPVVRLRLSGSEGKHNCNATVNDRQDGAPATVCSSAPRPPFFS